MRLFLTYLLFGCALAHASGTPLTEVRVSLFGQPCLLQGPLDEKVLRTIHSLSPEELYPARDVVLVSQPTRQALEKLRTTTPPTGLDRYRERLIRRLEAQLALLDAIEGFKKTRKDDLLQAAAKKNLSAARGKAFVAQIKKLELIKDLNSEKGHEGLDSIFDSYSEGIEADPEEEFHRAIQRMSVQYTCTFEESHESDPQ